MSWATAYIGRQDMHCWALVRDVYAMHCGVDLPSYGEVDAEELYAVANAVESKDCPPWVPVHPFPGGEAMFDIAVMKGWLPCNDGLVRRGVIHTGVITRPGYVLHTDMGYSVVEVPLGHATVRRRLVGCYRHTTRVG